MSLSVEAKTVARQLDESPRHRSVVEALDGASSPGLAEAATQARVLQELQKVVGDLRHVRPVVDGLALREDDAVARGQAMVLAEGGLGDLDLPGDRSEQRGLRSPGHPNDRRAPLSGGR
jgi:hypothetical protein